MIHLPGHLRTQMPIAVGNPWHHHVRTILAQRQRDARRLVRHLLVALPPPAEPRRFGRIRVPADLQPQHQRGQPHRLEDQLHALGAVAHECAIVRHPKLRHAALEARGGRVDEAARAEDLHRPNDNRQRQQRSIRPAGASLPVADTDGRRPYAPLRRLARMPWPPRAPP